MDRQQWLILLAVGAGVMALVSSLIAGNRFNPGNSYLSQVNELGNVSAAVNHTAQFKTGCGKLLFEKRLANTYQDALAVYSRNRQQDYRRLCPENPCKEIYVDSKRFSGVTDLQGSPAPRTFYAVTIYEKSTNLFLDGERMIDDLGNLYGAPSCPD